MTQIAHISLLLLVVLLLQGCKKHDITITEYIYSDSITNDGSSRPDEYDFKSSIRLHLLSSNSDDSTEQKIVKCINNSILDMIAPELKNTPTDSIAKYLVDSNISEMRNVASDRDRIEKSHEGTDDIPSSYDDTEVLFGFRIELTTDCKFGLGDSIICYSGTLSTYTGGAHPGDYVFATNYSLKNGSKVRLNSLFDRKSKEELCRRITEKLIKRENVKNEDELRGMGINEIYVPDNFLLGKDTLTILYDACSIAPYVYGPIDIKFLYDEVSDLSPYLQEK